MTHLRSVGVQLVDLATQLSVPEPARQTRHERHIVAVRHQLVVQARALELLAAARGAMVSGRRWVAGTVRRQ